MRSIVIAIVMVMAAAAPGTAGPKSRNRPPMATLRTVSSVDAYCTALGAKPAVSSPYGDDEPIEPGCVLDHPAWSDNDDARGLGPFFSLRVVSITTPRGEPGCALFVELGDRWYVTEDAVDDCYDPRQSYADASGSFSTQDGRIVIETSAGYDPCGCDEELWLGHETVTVCGVSPGGEPACTQSIMTQHTNATAEVMRTWAMAGRDLKLSPWWYGTHVDDPTAAHERAGAGDGGGPAKTYRLPF